MCNLKSLTSFGSPNISKQQEKSHSWRVRMKVEEFYPLPFFSLCMVIFQYLSLLCAYGLHHRMQPHSSLFLLKRTLLKFGQYFPPVSLLTSSYKTGSHICSLPLPICQNKLSFHLAETTLEYLKYMAQQPSHLASHAFHYANHFPHGTLNCAFNEPLF